ncbi:MAG TPA: bL28 family ribosomal protein [Candidatus Saccharimonadales bacterium]|nr:bL28 family ribosomal protein [Candidatus Saccharimonadales bacterium]
MSRICDFCGKGYLKANQVPRGVGRRVTRRTTIHQKPNLRSTTIEINGANKHVRICASCLKRMDFDIKKSKAAEASSTV